MGSVSVWGLVTTSSEKPREIIGSSTHGGRACTSGPDDCMGRSGQPRIFQRKKVGRRTNSHAQK